MPKPESFTACGDWLACDTVRVYAGNNGLAMDRAAKVARDYADKFVWEFPRQHVLFFCDLHGDAEAFRRSLIAGKAIVCHSKDLLDFDLSDFGKAADIVIAGDIFDKGPSNLDVLELLSHLRSLGAKIIVLAGNHDLRIWLTLKALDAKELEAFDYLAEHLERAQLLVSEVLARAVLPTPLASLQPKKAPPTSKKGRSKKAVRRTADEQGRKALQTLFGPALASSDDGAYKGRKAWLIERWQEIEAFYRQRGIAPDALCDGLMLAYDLLVAPSGRHAWIFAEMQLLHRYGSFLLAHGGVDDQLCAELKADGVDGINKKFRKLLAKARPSELAAGAFGNSTLTKYRPSDEPLTAAGVRRLHGEGIFAIVHGHDNQIGQQNVAYRQELLHFQCDATLNRCTRKLQGLSPRGMAVVIFEPEGRLTALSSDRPEGKTFAPKRCTAPSPGFLHTLLKSFAR